jgi:hypothetical protein
MSRISKGFHRLGILFALPFIIATGWTAWLEYSSPSGPERPTEGAKKVLVTLDDGSKYTISAPNGFQRTVLERSVAELQRLEEVTGRRMVAPGRVFTFGGMTFSEPTQGLTLVGREWDFRLALVFGAIASLLYAAVRLLGWTINGFVAGGSRRV